MNHQSRLKRGQVRVQSFIMDKPDLWKINGRPYPLLLIGLTSYDAAQHEYGLLSGFRMGNGPNLLWLETIGAQYMDDWRQS
jgi:hypothetical protein